MDQTWTWNRAQKLRVSAVEISYLRGTCGMTRWEDKSNESMYEKCGMEPCVNGEVWHSGGEKKVC